jgi:hypothetical protein
MENEKVIDMVEEDEIMETKFSSKVKKYIKGNWKKIAVAVGVVAVGAIGYTFGKNSETIVYDLPPVDESDDVENASTPEE